MNTPVHAAFAVLNVTFCLAVLWSVVCSLHAMSPTTSRPVKYSILAIGAGCLLAAFSPPDADLNGFAQLCVLGGMAGSFVFGRRRFCFSCPAKRWDDCKKG